MCKHCGKKHNTLLHISSSKINISVSSQTDPQKSITAQPPAQTVTTFSQPSNIQQTLLPTVELYVLDKQGNKHIARAVLDSACQ